MPVDAPLRPKRIQRGLITLASGTLQQSTTILAIDPTRSEIRYHGFNTNGAPAGASSDQSTARLWLQNSTTLWAVRTAGGNVMDVAWEITEW